MSTVKWLVLRCSWCGYRIARRQPVFGSFGNLVVENKYITHRTAGHLTVNICEFMRLKGKDHLCEERNVHVLRSLAHGGESRALEDSRMPALQSPGQPHRKWRGSEVQPVPPCVSDSRRHPGDADQRSQD